MRIACPSKLPLCMALAACLLAAGLPLHAADKYPVRPVRFIIPFPPGGGNDILGRAYAEKMAERTGQPWVVDNRGGASTIIGAEIDGD